MHPEFSPVLGNGRSINLDHPLPCSVQAIVGTCPSLDFYERPPEETVARPVIKSELCNKDGFRESG